MKVTEISYFLFEIRLFQLFLSFYMQSITAVTIIRYIRYKGKNITDICNPKFIFLTICLHILLTT